jgi:hypothetical protein
MDEDDFPVIPCLPPLEAEVGDSWICPDCARKFHYLVITLESENIEANVWFTSELR